tara:strand:- start:1350 stop:3164 length:1815 start_codon:yes stop_codon:yes gene_type:complete
MANNSKITGIRKKASASVDKAEGTIGRFARFMGTISKTKDVPDKSKLKKARKFAKNFSGGRSSKVNKMLLGSALMLPMVLGTMMAKNQSTEDILINQYGGDEKAMQADLKEEQKIRDEGLEKVKATSDENKDIAMDKQQDVAAVSQQKPEQSELKPEQPEDDKTTLEKLEEQVEPEGPLTAESVKQFDELMERFQFLEKQGAFMGGLEKKKKNIIQTGIDFVRTVVQSVPGDGYWGPRWLGIKNPFSDKWKNETDEKKSDIQKIEEQVKQRIAENEQAFLDAGGILLKPDSEEFKEYLRNKTELEKLEKRIQEEPLEVVVEFMSAANNNGSSGTTVIAQTNLLNIDGSHLDLKKKIRQLESGNDYSSMYARNRATFSRGNEDITKMTIDEVHDLQTDYLNHQKALGYDSADGHDRSAAMGAYQMMEVKAVAQSMGFDTSKTLFNKETQDKMADYYLNIAGYQQWKAGKISDQQFNDALAIQFASIKKASGKGAHDGDGMNNAYGNIMPLLKQLREGANTEGLQSSLEPDKVNQIAALEPNKYMPYDEVPLDNGQPQIAFAIPQPDTSNLARMSGNSSGEGVVVQRVADNGAVLSLMQLHSLALT